MLETLTRQLAAAQVLSADQIGGAIDLLVDEKIPAQAKADFLGLLFERCPAVLATQLLLLLLGEAGLEKIKFKNN